MDLDVAMAKTVESIVDPHRILASQPTAAQGRKPLARLSQVRRFTATSLGTEASFAPTEEQ